MEPLVRKYYLVRHGESAANVAKRINSRALRNRFDPPLTDAGADLVRENVAALLEREKLAAAEIVSSPFLRARQTSAIVADALDTTYAVDWRLRERDFGIFDRLSDSNYLTVWKNDEAGKLSNDYLVEPLEHVFRRIKSLIDELEASGRPDPVILCTHGDVASIAIAGYSHGDLSEHRKIGALSTAGIRRL